MEKHRHCLNCGISIPPDETFCSERCKDEYIKKRKRVMRIQLITLFVIFVILVVLVGLKSHFL
ncbi:MAG TPA: DUF2116 family Zn-ribbon domain-containing protein [Methanothermococcus okinawensis]|uniref:DUF2116 family Zn-ribbon domain-containing protein n=1 Tax=Methanofervidicoccus abyssi TaxID=2082189 RepID=UPI0010354166|nr:DUF2116 family Zn-ribbon domain-containing protein [Methanofervidicoccus abyssi]HIP15738.1 DUF2116 family Zn-ribbon domain-containing protein [Methanothermococcus okinawensis]HIP34697.1 DUF2116 family Zn-ribbon domain-containing protein [Methanothermococcus okinawensis]